MGWLVGLFLLLAGDPPAAELRVTSVELASGGKGTASFTVAPLGARELSADAPVIVRLSVAPGAPAPALKRLGRKDAVDPQAESLRFAVPIAAGGAKAGDHVLAVEVRAWVCRRRTCRPITLTTDLPVRVLPPAGR